MSFAYFYFPSTISNVVNFKRDGVLISFHLFSSIKLHR
jgi:hypothetical protein